VSDQSIVCEPVAPMAKSERVVVQLMHHHRCLQFRLRLFLGLLLEKQSFHFLIRRVVLSRGQIFLIQPIADPLLKFVVPIISSVSIGLAPQGLRSCNRRRVSHATRSRTQSTPG
jgi:hypothetical protein